MSQTTEKFRIVRGQNLNNNSNATSYGSEALMIDVSGGIYLGNNTKNPIKLTTQNVLTIGDDIMLTATGAYDIRFYDVNGNDITFDSHTYNIINYNSATTLNISDNYDYVRYVGEYGEHLFNIVDSLLIDLSIDKIECYFNGSLICNKNYKFILTDMGTIIGFIFNNVAYISTAAPSNIINYGDDFIFAYSSTLNYRSVYNEWPSTMNSIDVLKIWAVLTRQRKNISLNIDNELYVNVYASNATPNIDNNITLYFYSLDTKSIIKLFLTLNNSDEYSCTYTEQLISPDDTTYWEFI